MAVALDLVFILPVTKAGELPKTYILNGFNPRTTNVETIHALCQQFGVSVENNVVKLTPRGVQERHVSIYVKNPKSYFSFIPELFESYAVKVIITERLKPETIEKIKEYGGYEEEPAPVFVGFSEKEPEEFRIMFSKRSTYKDLYDFMGVNEEDFDSVHTKADTRRCLRHDSVLGKQLEDRNLLFLLNDNEISRIREGLKRIIKDHPEEDAPVAFGAQRVRTVEFTKEEHEEIASKYQPTIIERYTKIRRDLPKTSTSTITMGYGQREGTYVNYTHDTIQLQKLFSTFKKFIACFTNNESFSETVLANTRGADQDQTSLYFSFIRDFLNNNGGDVSEFIKVINHFLVDKHSTAFKPENFVDMFVMMLHALYLPFYIIKDDCAKKFSKANMRALLDNYSNITTVCRCSGTQSYENLQFLHATIPTELKKVPIIYINPNAKIAHSFDVYLPRMKMTTLDLTCLLLKYLYKPLTDTPVLIKYSGDINSGYNYTQFTPLLKQDMEVDLSEDVSFLMYDVNLSAEDNVLYFFQFIKNIKGVRDESNSSLPFIIQQVPLAPFDFDSLKMYYELFGIEFNGETKSKVSIKLTTSMSVEKSDLWKSLNLSTLEKECINCIVVSDKEDNFTINPKWKRDLADGDYEISPIGDSKLNYALVHDLLFNNSNNKRLEPVSLPSTIICLLDYAGSDTTIACERMKSFNFLLGDKPTSGDKKEYLLSAASFLDKGEYFSYIYSQGSYSVYPSGEPRDPGCSRFLILVYS